MKYEEGFLDNLVFSVGSVVRPEILVGHCRSASGDLAKMNLKLLIIVVVLSLCVVCFGIGWCEGVKAKSKLPTIEQFQKRIGCKKIDGKVSPDWRNSETQACWELALGDQYAEPHFAGWEK